MFARIMVLFIILRDRLLGLMLIVIKVF